jgi:hypothetical protein
MDRADLERLDREALIARAEAVGVARARILTRPELVDELILRSAGDQADKERSRGLFGRARDLLARVVERGLHLPEAAERIRSMSMGPVPASRPSAPAALPTLTLAEIYASQGHRERAVETLDRVLAREPDHAPARALVAQLRDGTYPVPPPRLPPEEELAPGRGFAASQPVPGSPDDGDESGPADTAEKSGSGGFTDKTVLPEPSPEPLHMLDDSPLPTRYDVDECVAIPVDPTTIYVYWEVRSRSLDYLCATRPGGALALRAIVITPTWDGPRSTVRDHDVGVTLGDFFIRELPSGCVVRVAIGLRHADAFVPIAHSPALETPSGAAHPLLAPVLVRWTPAGIVALATSDRDSASIQRAVARVRREVAVAERARQVPEVNLGSSERWAEAPASPRA